MEKVTENIYAWTNIRGCNPGYIQTSEGAVLVDTPQLPTKAISMRDEILQKNPIRFLINTESRIDHVFGNNFFKGLYPIIAHGDIMEDYWKVSSGDTYSYMERVIKKDDPEGPRSSSQ